MRLEDFLENWDQIKAAVLNKLENEEQNNLKKYPVLVAEMKFSEAREAKNIVCMTQSFIDKIYKYGDEDDFKKALFSCFEKN